MTDSQDLIREIQEHTSAHGGENTSTHLLVQAALALQRQADELAAIGAGGVSPLIGQPQAVPDLSQLTERGAVAWAGVDAQGLREGRWYMVTHDGVATLCEDRRDAKRTAHVQNPAEIEHVAGDVSKNGAELNTSTQQPAPAGATFQQRVQPWLLECFGAEIAADRMERNHRFFEESTELVQANGMTSGEAHQLVDYVFGRPVGDPPQEVGGVMVTLAALCLASGLDMHDAGEVELTRISAPEVVAKIRAKQAAKPKHSPLPEATTTQAVTPTAASIAWTALRDLTDPLGEDGVKIMGHVRIYAQRQYEAGLTEGRATLPIHAAGNVLEDAGGANWQDISTAPKDGTRFVAVGNNYGLYSEGQHTCIAQWFRGCWMDVSDWNEASELKYLTHWMPLLPLPGTAARKQGGA